jgi:hypothetical protein
MKAWDFAKLALSIRRYAGFGFSIEQETGNSES